MIKQQRRRIQIPVFLLTFLLAITTIQQCQAIISPPSISAKKPSSSFIRIVNRRQKQLGKDAAATAFHLDSILSIQRGGAINDDDTTDDEYDTDDDDYDTDTDTDVSDDEESDNEDTDEEEGEVEEDEYDDESEEDEDQSTQIAASSGVGTKSSSSSSSSTDTVKYDEPLSLSAITDMGITLGVMVLCNKLDLTNAKIIKAARFAFIAYVVIVQLFLIYVRFQAHNTNDRTPITITNPLTNMVQNQLNVGGDMVKNMASSFLSSQSTVIEYDLSQAKSMNSGLLLPMGMLYVLHFRMNQVQPLFFQTASGVKDFIMSPLFQVYVLGRNLERPFKNPKLEEMQNKQEELAGLQKGDDTDSSVDEQSEKDAESDDADVDVDEGEAATADDEDDTDDYDSDYDTDSDDYDTDDEYDEED